MAEPIKFTTEELDKLKNLQTEYQSVIYNLGQIQLEKRILDNREQEINSIYQSLVEKEKTILEDLNKKYGVGSLDLNSGTFTPNN